jgi:Uma2 family endonuclease
MHLEDDNTLAENQPPAAPAAAAPEKSAPGERVWVELPPGYIIFRPDFDPPVPPKNLPETDGVPLESEWHRLAIALLIESIRWHWRERKDFYVGGNTFVYFSEQQVRNKDYRGPDFFLVRGVPSEPVREYWAIWDEDGRYPELIIELLSKSTRDEDLTTKKELYKETFRAHEYCCYDPADRQPIGWRNGGKFTPIEPNERGWLWLEVLGVWLGTWHGSYHGMVAYWPRFFDAQGNLVLTKAEFESIRADKEKEHAEAERQHAEAERQRAEAEGRRAEAEKQRAETEKQRADALAAELARLQAQLASKNKPRQP